MHKVSRVLVAIGAVATVMTSAQAQYASDFEGLVGSSAGIPLTGQDGFYIPGGTTSVDYLVYFYGGNALGLPQNPEGGNQFVGGTGPGDGATFARAQRDVNFGDQTETWVITYDFAAAYVGAPPSAQNVGSFSLRGPGATDTDYIHLFSWVDPAVPTDYNAFYMAYDAGGVQFPQPGVSPGMAWDGVALNHWYRASATVDLLNNVITEVSITDLSSGDASVFNPIDWFLDGGAAGGAPTSNFRFFAGGSVPGNSTAFDNMSIEILSATPVLEKTWGGVKEMFR